LVDFSDTKPVFIDHLLCLPKFSCHFGEFAIGFLEMLGEPHNFLLSLAEQTLMIMEIAG
jgi:hypothetical protein